MKHPNILKSKNPISVSALTAHHGSAAPRVRHTGPPLVVLGRHVTIALKYDRGYYNEQGEPGWGTAALTQMSS